MGSAAPVQAPTLAQPRRRMSNRTVAVLVTPLLVLGPLVAALGLAYLAGAVTSVLPSIGWTRPARLG